MREIVLDTETTGLDPLEGHRIVEIGAVELFNHLPTGRSYHQYVNPRRDMPQEAFDVHGISSEFLSDKPVFEAVARDFMAFCGDARLVIHNAAFDMKFINAELVLARCPELPMSQVVDTLALARRKFPGSPASLDALCRRFGIDNSRREKHGALLDSEILAEVYLELVGGRQPGLVLGTATGRAADAREAPEVWRPRPRARALEPRLTQAEASTHAAFIEELGDDAIWRRYAGHEPGAA